MLAAVPTKKKKPPDFDALVFDYQRRVNSATFIGNTVVYDRDVWDGINDAFTRIINACLKEWKDAHHRPDGPAQS